MELEKPPKYWRTDAIQSILENAPTLSLTPQEEYDLEWDAVSDDWVRAKSKEIQDGMEKSASTAVLKRKSVKPVAEKPTDREAGGDPASGAGSGKSSGSGGSGATSSGGSTTSSRAADGSFDGGGVDGALQVADAASLLGSLPLGIGWKLGTKLAEKVAINTAFNRMDSTNRATADGARAASLPGGSGMQTVSDKYGVARTVANDKTIAQQDARNFGDDGGDGGGGSGGRGSIGNGGYGGATGGYGGSYGSGSVGGTGGGLGRGTDSGGASSDSGGDD